MRRLLMMLLLLTLIALPLAAQDDEASALPEPEHITLEAGDGLALVGEYYAQDEAAPAVLLLHMLGSNRGAWGPFLTPLYDAGYSVLAVDMRGHGETGGSRDWDLALTDKAAWLDWLREQEAVLPENISVVGASIGGNVALITCADDAACVTAIALSPGQDYQGVQPSDAVQTGLADRSVLLVGGWNDGSVPADLLAMTTGAEGEIALRLYPTRAHGTNFFREDNADRVISTLITWLDEHQG